MNRIIKFRVPHFDPYGVFVYFSYWGTIDYKGEPSLDHGCFVSPSSGMKKGWHEQFTGLTDKNGTDIYEGNLYDDEGHILEVKYGQYEYAFDSECPVEYHVGFYVKRHTPNGWTIQPLDVVTHYDTVNLVGNIHEHPELICT